MSNLYKPEVKPFPAEAYKLLIDGTGVETAAYKKLVDCVRIARSGR